MVESPQKVFLNTTKFLPRVEDTGKKLSDVYGLHLVFNVPRRQKTYNNVVVVVGTTSSTLLYDHTTCFVSVRLCFRVVDMFF